ncbi:MAG TPA: hypothetical protein ENI73_06880 [Spirochaetes bacterium]|nr:hypothetical protein [Spirochaetota bacterium]
MNRRKYTLYTLDKNNRFLKDCLHQYLEDVKSFDDHFTPEQLAKIEKFRKDHQTRVYKGRKPHKYHP